MKLTASPRRDPFVWAVAALTGAALLACAGRYDFFRNELYYIVCGRHPAFGYADQPPLVPLLAAATQLFGLHVWALRVPAALAGAALVPLTASFARLLGGGGRAALVAALAVAVSPALTAMAQIVTTSTFEALAWTLTAYFVTRAVLREDGRDLLWAGVAAGLGLQAKYGVLLWLAGLVAGLLATPARRALATRRCGTAALVAGAIAAPSLVWQAAHGWPFVQVMLHHAEGHTNFTGTPARFEIGQAFAMNVVLAPLWLAGLVAPFALPRLRPVRFLPIAYAVTAAIDIAARGKDYYLFPAYPTLFALGAAACATVPRLVVVPWLGLAVVAFLPAIPVVLPVLEPQALAAYLDRHPRLRPKPDELAGVGAPLTQVFSDELGWRALEKDVAAIYRALPPEDRERAAIIGSNYGEAAAIDVYGAADGLPRALSGQNQYFFWGPGRHDGSVVIHINGNPDRWRGICDSLEVAGTFGVPFAMPYENGRPIMVCRGLHHGLAAAWPYFKRFQ